MKRILLLSAAIYIMPKVQPTWPGMIVRCTQPEAMNIVYFGGTHTPNCPDDKCQCHWECENGVDTEPVIENGNQTAKPRGCKERSTERTSPFYNTGGL